MTVRALFSWKWLLPTILVIAGMVLLVRLGFWQLDRLEQKHSFNTMMAERWRSEPFDLNAQTLPADLAALEYRRVQAQGAFDYARQILISNQVLQGGASGFMVVTPLVLDDNRAVLVSRGWIPADMGEAEQLAQLTEAAGAPLLGLARQSQGVRDAPPSTPVATPQAQWYRIDIPAIQGQMPYQLEPGYLEMLPEEGRASNAFPMRSEPLALDTGNHLGYAIQWFTFAAVLGFGYSMLVRQRTRQAAGLIKPAATAAPMPQSNEPILAGDQTRPVHER